MCRSSVASGWVFVFLLSLVPPAIGQTPINPLMRYNNIAETTYRLSNCGELTPERKEWLLHLLELATRPMNWSDAQWEAHDAELMKNLPRLYPSDTKEKCASLAQMVDHERKTTPRSP